MYVCMYIWIYVCIPICIYVGLCIVHISRLLVGKFTHIKSAMRVPKSSDLHFSNSNNDYNKLDGNEYQLYIACY